MYRLLQVLSKIKYVRVAASVVGYYVYVMTVCGGTVNIEGPEQELELPFECCQAFIKHNDFIKLTQCYDRSSNY
jgi:hypothetical protein